MNFEFQIMDEGFLLIDKPKGITSFFMVKVFRKLFDMKKIGYAGTLDPLASGLMIFAFGKATKSLHDLEGLDKTYDATISFGAVSATYDSEGPIYPHGKPQIFDRPKLEEVLKKHFRGQQIQKPPIYSAQKIKGEHAYSLARRGQIPDVKSKTVTFFRVDIQHFSYPALECSVHCGSGTYIRSFAHDLGQILQCGAYVEALRRTKIGSFSIENAVPFEKITALTCRNFLVPTIRPSRSEANTMPRPLGASF